MSRRIDIELTSARPDGTWTWRAAGARNPKECSTARCFPRGQDRLGVEGRHRRRARWHHDPLGDHDQGEGGEGGLLELIPSEKPFEASPSCSPGPTAMIAATVAIDATARRAATARGDRRPRRDTGDRPPRREGERGPRSRSRGSPAGDRPAARAPAAAPGPIVARVRSAAAARTSPHLRSCPSDPSRSG